MAGSEVYKRENVKNVKFSPRLQSKQPYESPSSRNRILIQNHLDHLPKLGEGLPNQPLLQLIPSPPLQANHHPVVVGVCLLSSFPRLWSWYFLHCNLTLVIMCVPLSAAVTESLLECLYVCLFLRYNNFRIRRIPNHLLQEYLPQPHQLGGQAVELHPMCGDRG